MRGSIPGDDILLFPIRLILRELCGINAEESMISWQDNMENMLLMPGFESNAWLRDPGEVQREINQ